jgi:hypothetical protein
MTKNIIATGIICLGLGAPVGANAFGFDPEMSCEEALYGSNVVSRTYASAWVMGYLAAKTGTAPEVNEFSITDQMDILAGVCDDDRGQSLRELADTIDIPVMTMAEPEGDEPPAGPPPGSEADARRLLSEFLVPGADLAALTYSLKPERQDILAVYEEPLASKLVATYDRLFTPTTALGPSPGQDSILIFYSTTGALKGGDPMLREFPGGYRKVVEYMIPDYPVIRFKFVKSGETLGMASDGLIFVNDHWVLMPKPWKSLR